LQHISRECNDVPFYDVRAILLYVRINHSSWLKRYTVPDVHATPSRETYYFTAHSAPERYGRACTLKIDVGQKYTRALNVYGTKYNWIRRVSRRAYETPPRTEGFVRISFGRGPATNTCTLATARQLWNVHVYIFYFGCSTYKPWVYEVLFAIKQRDFHFLETFHQQFLTMFPFLLYTPSVFSSSVATISETAKSRTRSEMWRTN